ncbi:MAG: hypothetical protein ABI832_05385 [bacterium]
MSVALILLSLAALFGGICGWLWLCAQFRAPGWRGVFGRLALQVSAVCLVYGVIRGQPLNGLFMAAFPVLAVPELIRLSMFRLFLAEIAWPVMGAAALGLGIALAVPRLRDWTLGLTLLAASLVAVGQGERVSRAAMCQTALAHGFSSFDRNSLFTSLAAAPREFQFDLHGLANVPGQVLGWSYRDMDWYVIPADTVPNVAGGESYVCP